MPSLYNNVTPGVVVAVVAKVVTISSAVLSAVVTVADGTV